MECLRSGERCAHIAFPNLLSVAHAIPSPADPFSVNSRRFEVEKRDVHGLYFNPSPVPEQFPCHHQRKGRRCHVANRDPLKDE